ncbi:DUF5104 domain-containing protein [Raoultibacter timonensis]|uniref:DUF5104 domain-containing protein n=1 Tax=Raoultibacter timonensis TaxID=1907662 RepID=UPI001FCAC735|nr:DUF5104 domain-containing protein [Raoultibacter timonensis]
MKRFVRFWMVGALAALCLACCSCGLAEDLLGRGAGEGYVSEEERLFNEAVDGFFAAVDARDAAAIRAAFAPNVRDSHVDLDRQIEELFEAYPDPTDVCKRDGGTVAGSYSTDHGVKTAEVSSGFPVVSGERSYWCFFELVYRNDADEGDVGIKNVTLYSAEYRCAAMLDDERARAAEASGEQGIQVFTDISLDYEVRFIGGYPEKFVSIDRVLTEDEAAGFFETSRSYSAFVERFGEPNSESGSGVSFAFELPAEQGEPRYLDLVVDDRTDEIVSAYVQNDLDVVAVSTLWSAMDS